jgi:hypothetical protein
MLPYFNNLFTSIRRSLMALICLCLLLPATAGTAFATTGESWQGKLAKGPASALAPNSPTRLTATLMMNRPQQVLLAWSYTNNPKAPATGFQVFRMHQGVGVANQYIPLGQTPVTIMTFLEVGLAPASQYFYRVYAVRGMGNNIQRSDFYAGVIISTAGSTYCYRSEANRPRTPLNPRATTIVTGANSASVTLTWANAGQPDLIMIYRRGRTPTWSNTSPLFGSTATYMFRIALPGTSATFTDSDFTGAGLKRNSYYEYEIWGYTMDGCFCRNPARAPITTR